MKHSGPEIEKNTTKLYSLGKVNKSLYKNVRQHMDNIIQFILIEIH
jgi:hypothetical protein